MQNKAVSDFPLFLPNVTKTSAFFGNLLSDEKVRLAESRKALFYTIEKGYFDKIVIVDGSNQELLSKTEIDELFNNGIIIEQLLFQQNSNMVKTFGKGNGEMQITNYMVNNSKLVNETGGFVKITPRYFFDNIDAVMPIVNEKNNVFFYYYPKFIRLIKPYVCSIFYKTSLEFYKTNFENTISQHSIEVSGYAESVFYRNIKGLKRTKVYVEFPHFSGLAGTTGKSIRNQYFKLRNALSMLGFMCYDFK